ncbi:MAG: hypothetical protein ABIG96_02735 [Candidatus Micrarchaeota archaeon]
MERRRELRWRMREDRRRKYGSLKFFWPASKYLQDGDGEELKDK